MEPQQRTDQPRSSQGPARPAPQRRRRRVRATQPATTVWKGTVVALVVFVVLASGNMVSSAQGMPLGWQRSVAVVVAGAIDRVANFFSLNRPYDWAADRLGLDQGGGEDFEFPEPTPATEPGSPAATTTTLPPVRVPTPTDPLRLVVAGDSTAKSLGDALIVATEDLPVRITNEGKVSTGLSRSDYFNWGARMAELVDTDSPEVVVFMVGANDGQAILSGDGEVVAAFDTPEWETAYRERVAGIMDLVGGDGRRLVWVGEPDVETGNVQRAIRIGNRLASEEAASRPWVTFVDVAAMLRGPDGGYSAYLTLPDGSTTRCYAGDGVHLTTSCLDRVMDDLVPTLTGLYESTDSAPASTATDATSTDATSTDATSTDATTTDPASGEPATRD